MPAIDGENDIGGLRTGAQIDSADTGQGLAGKAEDMGKFRAPTLRNIAVTAPYMHDGSITTLGEVLDHYARGGRAANPLHSQFITGFAMSAQEKEVLYRNTLLGLGLR